MDAATWDLVQKQQRDLERMKKTIQNHTGKLEDILATVNAMQKVMDGWRRKGLRFEARPIEDGGGGEKGEGPDGVQ